MVRIPKDLEFNLRATPDGRPLKLDEVAITIHAVDVDDDEERNDPSELDTSDVIDLSGQEDSPETDFKMTYGLGTILEQAKPITADGGQDSRGWPGDDDARLDADYITKIPYEFIQRALEFAPKKPIVPPTLGSSTGEV